MLKTLLSRRPLVLCRPCLLLLGCLLLAACQNPGLSQMQREQLLQERFLRTAEGWELNFSNKILFASDTARIKPQSRANIERIGFLLKQMQPLQLRLDGHCDATGSDAYNIKLSLRRAQAVADILLDVGLPQDALQVRGLGKRLPLADNKTRQGRAENRRVAIVVLAH